MTKGHHEIESRNPIATDNSVHNTLHSEAYSRASATSSSGSESRITTGNTENNQKLEVSGNNANFSESVKYPRTAPDMATMITDESRSTGFQITTPIAGFGIMGESERYRDLQDARTTCEVATGTMAVNVGILARYGFSDQAARLADLTVESSQRCTQAVERLDINSR